MDPALVCNVDQSACLARQQWVAGALGRFDVVAIQEIQDPHIMESLLEFPTLKGLLPSASLAGVVPSCMTCLIRPIQLHSI